MRLTDILDKEHSFKYLLGLVFAVLFLLAVALPARTLGKTSRRPEQGWTR